MKPNFSLKLKHVVWAVAGLVLATLLGAVIHSGAKSTPQAAACARGGGRDR